jgi:hypothetical protein
MRAAFAWTFVCVREPHTHLFIILGIVRVCTGVLAYRFARLLQWIFVPSRHFHLHFQTFA